MKLFPKFHSSKKKKNLIFVKKIYFDYLPHLRQKEFLQCCTRNIINLLLNFNCFFCLKLKSETKKNSNFIFNPQLARHFFSSTCGKELVPPNRTHQFHRSFTSSTCFNVSHLYPNIPLIYICFVLNTYLRGPPREAIHLPLNLQQGSLFRQHPIPTLHPIYRKLRCRRVHQHPIPTLHPIHRRLLVAVVFHQHPTPTLISIHRSRCRRVHQHPITTLISIHRLRCRRVHQRLNSF